MHTVQGARDRVRAEITRAVTDAARHQLAEHGAAELSLRQVARDLGMASSAVYRYVRSRDELLTLLIVEAYDAVGEAAEQADAAARASGARPAARWIAVCRGVRAWALAHPHEYALVFGSPVPGYAAPQDTVGPASRIPRVMAAVLTDALAADEVRPTARPPDGRGLLTPEALALAGDAGGAGNEPYRHLADRSLLLWIALVGALSFELFGHLHNVVTDLARSFDVAMAVAAQGVGLELPLDPA